MKISTFFAIIFTLASKIRAECSSGQIFNLVSQQCLPCSSSCQDCFSTSSDSCISCPQNYYKSNLNSSTCVQNCEVGEIQADSQYCIKCQIVGCIRCDSKQNCLQCSPNLYFDKEKNECSLKPKICQSEWDFIQEPFTEQQCVNSCQSSYFPNQKTQICEKISQCIQINDSPPLLTQKVLELNSFNQDYYLIRANQCYFALVDQNFQIIYIEIFQDMPDFQFKYMSTGEEKIQKSFIFEEYGGCLANSSIKVMNFITKQIVFEQTDLDYDYYVQYIDYQNRIVFLNQMKICLIAWYDLIQQKLNKFPCDLLPIQGFSWFLLAILQEDRSLKFLETQLEFSDYLTIMQSTQKYQYLISIFSDYYQNQTSAYKQKNLIYQMIYFTVSEQVEQVLNITIANQINDYSFYENQEYNSTFVFLISDKLQFIYLTDYLIKLQNGYQFQNDTLIQGLKSGFITSQSTITNVFFKQNNIIEIFLSQILEVKTFNYQQIRISLNTTDQTYLTNYLNPNEYQKPYYDFSQFSRGNVQYYQNIFSSKKNTDINSFYIYDEKQILTSQALGVQKIQFSIQNLQKTSMITTRICD
ncbi:hypothetical protein TTHERM_00810530 (macronuclear) [Tetrahymena thermophila SB210]|uniref:Zinc finger protein n=1 Tax=Tetrahymena thermophila (strain SB210) TaxID=312017 RepID=Q22SY0_TETTS|nr:hypothetical protein TTHERM_00810530 [Tetrahymena thermophila SB210]EAR88334.2 hypothetical protein TTHERM_00810530 [Tetrahymena thermophila SB210]|eukprot:XP_001008579.2 hypothetical protein TTHERM_00810530 [Tetrahymena thermophila SB210]